MNKQLEAIEAKRLGERRAVLQQLYDELLPEQQAFFCRMYESLAQVSEEQLNWAVEQCERTILKNQRESDD